MSLKTARDIGQPVELREMFLWVLGDERTSTLPFHYRQIIVPSDGVAMTRSEAPRLSQPSAYLLLCGESSIRFQVFNGKWEAPKIWS